MIVVSIVFILVTIILLYYALFRRNTATYTRLEDVYKTKYHRDLEALERQLRLDEIDQESFEAEKAQLGRDLLAVAKQDRPVRFGLGAILILLMGAIAAGGIVYYWNMGYEEHIQEIDEERVTYAPELKQWVEGISLQDLRQGATLDELNPPAVMMENGRAAFYALNMISAKQNHNDLRYLYILGDAYLGLGALEIANDIYIRIYQMEVPQYRYFANSMFLYIQLEMNNFVLSERLEHLYDLMLQENPGNDRLIVQYGMILHENKRYDKAIRLFEYLADTYTNEAEMRNLFVGIISEIKQQQLEELSNIVRTEFHFDSGEHPLPETAHLYIYLRDGSRDGGPPLAAKKIPVGNAYWPIVAQISEDDFIMPSDKRISQYEELIVTGRISLDGDPIAKPEDYEFGLQVVKPQETNIFHFDGQ